MSTSVKALLLVLLVVVVIAVGYRINQNQSSNSSASSIKIGVLLPLTGRLASLGEDTKQGLELARADLEKELGRKIQLVYEDSVGDPKAALPAASKLLDVDRVALVIGGPGSSANLAVAPVMENRKIIFVALSLTPKLNEAGPYIFKGLADIDGEAKRMAAFLFKKGIRKVAIIYDSSSDSLTVGKSIFLQEFEKLGGRVVGVEGYDVKTVTDFRTILTNLKAKEPDALYILSAEKPAGTTVKQAKELGWSVPMYGFSVLEGDEFFRGAGRAAEGVTITAVPFSCHDPNEEKVKSYCDKFKQAANGRTPMYFGARAHDVLQVIIRSLPDHSGKSLTSENGKAAIMKALSEPQRGGVSGDIIFDQTGSVRDENFVFRVVKDGKFVKVEE